MPANGQALAIDWPGLKTAAIALGSVREAAMRAAGTLISPEERNRFVERVNKRAYRERWLDHPPKQTSPNFVQSGADTLATALADDSSATKLGFSKAARKVAEKLPTLSESALMDKDRAQAAKHWHGIAAGTHGWEQKAESSAVMVNVALLMG